MPASAGIGLRASHHREVLEQRPPVGWLEVHGENYFGAGGAPIACLDAVRAHYPLSIHCVGTSLGSVDPLDDAHLARVRALVGRYEPALISDHLCWSSVGGVHFNDLLPLPFTEEALAHVVARIGRVQDALGRQILVENLSAYLQFTHSDIPEAEFLNETARRSGCGLLLDVNNVYVSAANHGFDAATMLDAVEARHVGEVHLAGHAVNVVDGVRVHIDDHGSRVAEPVWALYERVVARLGAVPTLIEWDSDIPPLAVLAAEATRAQRVLDEHHAVVA